MRKLLVLGVACVLLGACTAGRPQSGGGVRATSSPLPELHGAGLDGAKLSSDAFRGKVLVVNVWASWCGPCTREQPQLVDVARRYRNRGVAFLGINSIDQVAAARTWVARYHVPYPSISDQAGRYAATLGYVGLPDTYVVDPHGTIRYVVTGPTDAAQLSGLLDQILAPKNG